MIRRRDNAGFVPVAGESVTYGKSAFFFFHRTETAPARPGN
jgi:hypothetical protein